MGKAKNAYTDMVKRIAKKTDLFDYQVRQVMVAFIQETITDLSFGRSVHIMSLGKFWMKRVKPRPGWNPKLGKKVMFPERWMPRFEFGGRAYDFIREEAARNLSGASDRGDGSKVSSGG